MLIALIRKFCIRAVFYIIYNFWYCNFFDDKHLSSESKCSFNAGIYLEYMLHCNFLIDFFNISYTLEYLENT